MGGFTSVPATLAGFLLRVPSFLHEQNVEPGLANRFLSRFARTTFVSFEATKNYFDGGGARVAHAGNPLRKGLSATQEKKKEGTFGVFVFGGSRGARSINQSVLTLLPYMESYKNTIMYHQTGQEDYEHVKAAYEKSQLRYEVFPFTDHMERYYALSDVVISRAGATTIFELALFKRAAILIPYPFSARQHQWRNAAHVESLGGAFVLGNEEATGERLHEALKHLMDEPDLMREMGENIGKLYVDDAAERIINGISTRVQG